jgi:hypothetical protein
VATLLDIITYEQVYYTELSNETEKQKVRDFALKLWPLHDEIIKCRACRIDIKIDGSITTKYFPQKIKSRILNLSDELGID